MTPLGASPPPVCICCHFIEDHDEMLGPCRDCNCPIFIPDSDR